MNVNTETNPTLTDTTPTVEQAAQTICDWLHDNGLAEGLGNLRSLALADIRDLVTVLHTEPARIAACSSGEQVLINLAAQMWNGTGQCSLRQIANLDDVGAFQAAMAAIRIYFAALKPAAF